MSFLQHILMVCIGNHLTLIRGSKVAKKTGPYAHSNFPIKHSTERSLGISGVGGLSVNFHPHSWKKPQLSHFLVHRMAHFQVLRRCLFPKNHTPIHQIIIVLYTVCHR